MRALSPTTPTYIFPAMNTLMYEHPLTAEHLRIIEDIVGYNVVGPIGKKLACGDIGAYNIASSRFFWLRHWCGMIVGVGAMTEWKDIVKLVVDKFHLSKAEQEVSL
jgi:phosphopantothenoylcysteine decarboxylase